MGTRSSSAYQDEIHSDGELIRKISAYGQRNVVRKDLNGVTIQGALMEATVTNSFWYSHGTTGWTTSGCNATGTQQDNEGPLSSPNRAVKIDGMGAGDTHGITRAGLLASKFLRTQLWLKRISTSGTLVIQNPADNAAGLWNVDLSQVPDGWVRVWNKRSFVSETNPFKSTAAGDGGIEFTHGAGGDLEFVYCACQQELQVTAGDGEPTSFIGPTTGSNAVRAADTVIRWAGSANLGGDSAGQYTFAFACLPLAFNPLLATNILIISDGGAVGDSIIFQLGTDGKISLLTAKTAGNAGSCTPNKVVTDGYCYGVVGRVDANKVDCAIWDYATGTYTAGTRDTSADIPVNLDRQELQPWNGIFGRYWVKGEYLDDISNPITMGMLPDLS